MIASYFNHRVLVASSRWQQREFLQRWWRFHRFDPYWVPPLHAQLHSALLGEPDYLRQRQPQLIHSEALRRKGRGTLAGSRVGQLSASHEWPDTVAATVALQPPDPRETIRLALLQCRNDAATLEHFLEQVAALTGTRALLGPTHLSPHLGAGTLGSHWNRLPPQDTPYNPPYLTDLLGEVMTPVASASLYHFALDGLSGVPFHAVARLVPIDPRRLAGDLLPLLQASCATWGTFSPPDSVEATFLLDWLSWNGRLPLFGQLALCDEVAVGFVLLRDDWSPALRRHRGGRRLLSRWRLFRAVRHSATSGRILFGGVLPERRRRGIGSLLLRAALDHAVARGWDVLHVGPLGDDTAGAAFAQHHGATAAQRYHLFRWQMPGWL